MANYVNTASVAQLSAPITAGATSCTVSSFTGWPTASFWAEIARGTASAEIVLVTNVAGSTLTITRGQDGTVASSHGAGDTIEHVAPAVHFVNAETHQAASSGVHGATGSVVGTTDAQTLTNKTYRGAHTSVFSDATPAGVTSSFESTADSAAARDGFVHKNTAGSASRRGFLLEQSGTPRMEVFNTGQMKLNPSATPGLENDGTTQLDGALTANSTATLNGAVSVNNTLGVTGAATMAGVAASGNVTVGGTLGVTGSTTTAAINATTLTASGAVSAASVAASGAVTGASATLSGALNSASAAVSGAITAGTVASTGVITAYGGRVIVAVSNLASITSPATDQVAYHTGAKLFYQYTGSTWRPLDAKSSQMRQNATQTVSHNTFESVAFPQEDWDNLGGHDNVTNNSRFTCAAGLDGKFTFSGGVSFTVNGNFSRGCAWFKNNAVVNASEAMVASSGNLVNTSVTARTISLGLVAGDYVELRAYQNSGSGLDLVANGSLMTVQYDGF